ncbi:MAG TPA: S8 family peptidase [Povalibacter sp.]|nr:S8 family peptidase [Povalibacter sp.]
MASKRAPVRRKKATSKTASQRTSRRAPLAARSVAASDVGAETAGRARTIVYVHGIGNKPTAETLKCQWDEALFGFNLGERSRLAYWVNRIFYPEPTKASCKMADSTQDGSRTEEGSLAIRALADPAEGVEPLVPANASKREREVLERIARQALPQTDRADISAADYHTRVLPLPKPLREFITRRITKAFLKDVHEFLFVKERRELMRESVLTRLRTGGGPFVVIAHSQGSMIAYDALMSLPADQFEIDLFVTIGSPLGLKEVQDQLKIITGQKKGLAVPPVVKRWVNVADPLDPVCADKRLAGDYAAINGVAVEDFVQWNTDSPRDPHSGSGYLRLSEVRGPVRAAIDRELFQRIAPFTIARDLVSSMENSTQEDRHPVLIELRDQWDGTQSRSADEVRSEVVEWINHAIRDSKPRLSADDIDLEALSGYVSAKLTRSEVERLSNELHLDAVYRVFQNARKRALLDQSIDVLQAATAHRGYQAQGQGITWAVLDSGIDPLHPHFGYGTARSNIANVYDCLKPGPVVEWDPKQRPKIGVDRNGHGTHVCGIIAGGMPNLGISGIAPDVKLRSYKVLDDDGRGSDAKIIKALDHIYDLNRNASSLVIHGVNLSLGGAFDPETFGCGDTPICKQLRKLWRQGVVVVLAAGNEGYLELQQGEDAVGLNVDLSIGDPANLDESIAVGSIHKSKPHLYGVSYFSSRGPTADGRCKPDVVAPGERIVSCRAGANPKVVLRNNLYVAMSGTSMAAPHVAGVVACFLSVRKEFIGYPDKVKDILMHACTDLKRDRMHQGAGMPNLVKMLLES